MHGVSINLLLGEDGIIARAKDAKEQTLIVQYKEQIEIIKAETRLKYDDGLALEKLKNAFDDDSQKHWVNNTEIITDNVLEKIKLTTNDGYIFYITDTKTEYKGKNGLIQVETTKITITATPLSQTENSVNKQEVELLINSSIGWTDWSGKYAWNTSNTTEPTGDDWESLTLEDKNSKEKTGKVEKKANDNGDYYLWVQITTSGVTTTKSFGAYKLVAVPTEGDLICILKSKSDNDTKGIVEIGSTKTFEGWTLSYTKNSGTKTEITQGTTTEINVVKNDYIEVIYSKSGETDVIKTLTITELKVGYTLNYDATEGIGAPSSLTQYDNTTFTVSSTKPTRDGYTFEGWTTSSDRTGTVYNTDGSITVTETATTLYAKWESLIAEKLDCFMTTGNQYIHTGVTSNQDITIEMKCNLLAVKNQALYGSRKAFFTSTYALIYDAYEERRICP